MRRTYYKPRPQRWRKPRQPASSRRYTALPPLLRMGICLIGLTGLLLLSGRKLYPALRTMSAHEANLACTRAISRAVEGQLAQMDPQYESLVSVTRSAQGSVTAVETNVAMADRLKTAVTQSILSALQEDALQQTTVPLGTLSGSIWLNGRGPRIPLKILPSRMIAVDIQSSFTEAGINQTLHQLMLTVDADAEAIIPGISASTHISTRFLLAETVIVGDVPDAYTSIQGAAELSGKIADYGASLPPLEPSASVAGD